VNKTIRMTLDPASINAAVRELEAYKKRVQDRTEELRKRVAQYIVDHAQPVFDSAVAADLVMSKEPGQKWEHESPQTGDVQVTTQDNGDITLVIATGHDAIFMEFGAGVYNNTPVGTSPHPNGAGLGFTIGSYGPNGAKDTWGYYDNGKLYLTHGTPASMPMYRATQAAINDIAEIAKEVFSR